MLVDDKLEVLEQGPGSEIVELVPGSELVKPVPGSELVEPVPGTAMNEQEPGIAMNEQEPGSSGVGLDLDKPVEELVLDRVVEVMGQLQVHCMPVSQTGIAEEMAADTE